MSHQPPRPPRRRRSVVVGLAFAVLVLAAVPAAAVDFGIRGGLYNEDSDPYVGVEVLTGLGGRWMLNPNVEAVDVERGDYFTFNLDFHRDFALGSDSDFWLGGGPALLYRDFDVRSRDAETDAGLNLLAGAGWRYGAIRPYVQGKLLLADDSTAVIGVGLRF